MEVSNVNSSKKELIDKYYKNINDINLLDFRHKIMQGNNPEFKMCIMLFFSVISYTVFLMLLPSFSLTLAPEIISVLIMFASLVLGYVGEELYYKKHKVKKRISKFSTSKTNVEKIAEEINYEIELEHALNKSVIIQKTFAGFEQKKGLKDNINNIEQELQSAYNKLNIITAKKILKDKFANFIDRKKRKKGVIIFSCTGGLVLSLCTNIPILVLNNSILANLFPLLLGGLIFGGYSIKRNRDYIQAFESFNVNVDDNIDYDYEINKLIDDITNLEIISYEIKNTIVKEKNVENKNNYIMNKTIDKPMSLKRVKHIAT